ncbi:MAG: protein-L-isoaspartate(D-aspartate) O-methyltransferase [Fibrobacterota bacterium]
MMESLNFLPHSVARARLVNNLREKGIEDRDVLAAIQSTPRHLFIDPGLAHKAYDDITLPIDHKQTISQPFIVALMTQLLDIEQGMKVLEIGTGSGYQTAVLHHFTHKLFTVERIQELSFKARAVFKKLNMSNIICKCGDGTQGWPNYAPYDRILVTAGAPAVPSRLLQQLKVGGKLVIPTGDRNVQHLEVYVKTAERIEREIHDAVAFVPLVGRDGWNNPRGNS